MIVSLTKQSNLNLPVKEYGSKLNHGCMELHKALLLIKVFPLHRKSLWHSCLFWESCLYLCLTTGNFLFSPERILDSPWISPPSNSILMVISGPILPPYLEMQEQMLDIRVTWISFITCYVCLKSKSVKLQLLV